MKYLQTYNESIRDKMKPKSDEDVIKGIRNIDEAMLKQIDNSDINAEQNQQTLNNIRLLLNNGADPYYANSALLRFAGWVGDVDFVKDLIEKYNVDINGGEGSLLQSASGAIRPELLNYIIDNGGDVETYGKDAVEYCIDQALNDERPIINECILILVNNGVNKVIVEKYLRGYFGDTSVERIMNELDEKLIKYNKVHESLVDKMEPKSKEHIISKIPKDLTPQKELEFGASNDILWLVKKAIKNGADIHYKNDDSLKTACQYGHYDIIKFLLENGADVNADKDAALYYASYRNSVEITKLLIEYGANVNATLGSPLEFAIRYENFELVKLLIENGAKIHKSQHMYFVNNLKNDEIVKYIKQKINK